MSTRASRFGWLAALPAAVVVASGSPQDVRLPPLQARSQPPPALFSHWAHQSHPCFSCHPSVFPQARVGFTHAQMQAGGGCGACHDGLTTRAISATPCEVCHAKE